MSNTVFGNKYNKRGRSSNYVQNVSQIDLVRYVDTIGYLEATKVMQANIEKFNPTLKSIMKVEDLFREHVEFDSKTQLLRKLEGSMKASVLNVILARLVMDNKIMINDDNSLTWIYAENNKKLMNSWKKAESL